MISNIFLIADTECRVLTRCISRVRIQKDCPKVMNDLRTKSSNRHDCLPRPKMRSWDSHFRLQKHSKKFLHLSVSAVHDGFIFHLKSTFSFLRLPLHALSFTEARCVPEDTLNSINKLNLSQRHAVSDLVTCAEETYPQKDNCDTSLAS